MRIDNSIAGNSKISVFQLINKIYSKNGLAGFYPNYRATLARNIPSALIRFTAYEEFKYILSKTMSSSSGYNIGAAVILIKI